ncbi:hypothetical protein DdX_06403 [Ditylenchus destructor]|uniref:Uncharacterized protein n=1 Tax=Ditylenchus destructor TaxID=166010 RepID=A0AAD4R2G7_9BILA|nr:hypothetical protein DdX_06403 [Ditylenchus destructor]
MQPNAPQEILAKFNFCQADEDPVSNIRVSLMDGSNSQNEISIQQMLQSASGPSRIPAHMIPYREYVEEYEDSSGYYDLPQREPDQEAKSSIPTENNEPNNTKDPE